MKKEMSSFDVRSIVSEMASLEGAHIDKIFHWGAGNVLFRLNVQGDGKRELFFKDKKWLYLAPNRPETPETPTSFATFLRKYITNAKIGKTVQVGFDRITVTEVFKSDAQYELIFEMFGGGNVLLVLDGKIVNCLTHKTWKDRSTRPGEDYIMPKSRFDPITSSFEEFRDTFRSSGSDTVRTLATVVNLGGQYSEEICKRTNVAKNTPSQEVDDGSLSRMYSSLREIVERVIQSSEPTIFRKDGAIADVAPVNLLIYEDAEPQQVQSMSLAIDELLKEIGQTEEEIYVDPETEKLKKRIQKQTETVDEYKMESEDLKNRADALYAEYQKVTELLAVLGQKSKELTWEKLTEGAMKISFVTGIDPSKNIVTANISDLKVTLDYTKGIDANASDIYQKSKDISEKAKRAEGALKESIAELEKKQKGVDKAKALAMSKAQPTKQFWFERYKWFITSSGKLVIAGRDAHSNDSVVKKHLKEKDVFVHAEVHGAPSVVLKDGFTATPDELREACAFALTQSKAWVAALTEGAAFWAYPDQVSKTPNPGEFVPRGAFIVRGKRNYEHHLKMELGIGEITYQGTRKVMCGPVELFKDSERYIILNPGRGKSGRKAGEIAKDFRVPEEEVSRILPPGDVEIARRVWKDEPEKQ
ncbi:MAG: NFACT family protein [Candidatus Methanoplasma sp.]|jgi:predicted ribosome quality control (RQC) complex YloA/Tae2 family protein|nr:NFACT family protein [Candidatus Methanoplasma sp.]